MHRLWRSLGASCAIVLCLLPTLTFATSPGPTAKPRPTPQAQTTGGTLRLAIPDASPQIDPAMVADEENVQLAGLLYSGLVRLDPSYHIVPDAAYAWKVSSNHRVYTFYLRPNLRFNNGDPVVARDFQFSITRALSPTLKSPSAPTYLLDIDGASSVLAGKATTVRGIRVLNDQTLQITVRWPVRYFLMELTYPTSYALDAKRLSKLAIDSTSWYADPIGSGPYRLKSWTQNVSMTLVRNQYFAGQRPPLKEVTLSLAPLPATDLYSYVTHTLDVVGLPSTSGSLGHQPGIREAQWLAIDGLYMNMRAKPFSSSRVRQALTMALNRTQIVSQVFGPSVTPFAGYVPSGEAGYDPSLKPLPYSPTQARTALKASGYADGKGFPPSVLYYSDEPMNPGIAKLARSIAHAWHRVLGIDVATQGLTLATLLAKAESNSLSMYLSGWSANFPDPHDWLSGQWETGAPNNNVEYDNGRFDKVVKTADVTWDDAQRMSLYDTAQRILVADAAWIPLYIPHRMAFVRPEVANLVVTGYGIMPRGGSWATVYIRTPPARPRRAK